MAAAVRELRRRPAMTTKTVNVSGMTCSHCVAAVTDEVSKIDGITSVDVDLDSGNVEVSSDRDVDAADIAAAVEEAGYHVSA